MRSAVLACALLALGAPAAAQEDFRSLDAGRPLRVMDAYPLKQYEWEVQAGLAGRLGEGRGGLAGTFVLEAGLLRNAAFALEVEPAFERADGSTASGIEELGAHMLYNLNQEGWSWPALAFEVGLGVPVGGELGRDGWAASGTLVATRSFAGGTRLHGNGGYVAADSDDGGDLWRFGMAADHALGLSGPLLAADVFAEVPVAGGTTRVWTGLGMRIQAGNRNVVDVGIATRIDRWTDGEANLELVAGISRVFGIRSLTPAPPYPVPAIR